jgi:hypothetical protein
MLAGLLNLMKLTGGPKRGAIKRVVENSRIRSRWQRRGDSMERSEDSVCLLTHRIFVPMPVTVRLRLFFELRFKRPTLAPPEPPDKNRKEPWSETGRRGSFLLVAGGLGKSSSVITKQMHDTAQPDNRN